MQSDRLTAELEELVSRLLENDEIPHDEVLKLIQLWREECDQISVLKNYHLALADDMFDGWKHALARGAESQASFEAGMLESIQYAEYDQVIHDALREFASRIVEIEEPMPESLKDWTARSIRGLIARPSRRGPRQLANADRDFFICILIDLLKRLRMNVTRSNASSEMSISDYVADGYGMSYENVVRIYQDRSKFSISVDGETLGLDGKSHGF